MSNTTEQNHYRIVRLQAENIKRIEAVDITPDGDLVIVAGKNGHGKTSVLDSIMYALGGKDCVAQEPVRRGSAKGKIVVDCGEFTATREFTQSGQQLVLKSKTGQPIKQPQTFLDSILGQLSFDPLAFTQMKPKERLESLLSLTEGLEETLAAIDRKRAKLYDERKEWNVTVRNLTGQLADMQAPAGDWPEGEVNPQVYIEEKNQLQSVVRDNRDERQKLYTLEDQVPPLVTRIEELKLELQNAVNSLDALKSEIKSRSAKVAKLIDPDISVVDAKLVKLIDLNKLAVQRRNYESTVAKKTAAEITAKELSDSIDRCDQEKSDVLASAKLPIAGLGFADGDVLYSGILFDQLSGAEQLKVSLAMAMAANPSMRVIRITNGSLLDETNLEVVRKMAVDNDYQVWIECVGNRDDASVIIENGKVRD